MYVYFKITVTQSISPANFCAMLPVCVVALIQPEKEDLVTGHQLVHLHDIATSIYGQAPGSCTLCYAPPAQTYSASVL